MPMRQRAAGTNLVASALNSGGVELRAVMNSPDQYTLVRAVEDARRILGNTSSPDDRGTRRERWNVC
jgi:hypothetical protein